MPAPTQDKTFADASLDVFRRQIDAAVAQGAQFTLKDIAITPEVQDLVGLMKSHYEAQGWGVNVSIIKNGAPKYQIGFSPPLPSAQPVRSTAPAIVPVTKKRTAVSVQPVLSVIFGTYNRFTLLQQAIESVRRSAAGLAYEIVVCDGGSTDESRVWLAMQRDVVLIAERCLEGAVPAFNKCFRLSRGQFIANLNDDCIVEGSALREGVEYLRNNPDAGQVAFSFKAENENWTINEIYPKKDNPDVSWPTEYVNFGITRREAAEQAAEIAGGFWNPIYKTYSGDCELSAWLHKLGWKIARLENLHVIDVRHSDGLRDRNNVDSGLELKRFWFRWPSDALRPDGPMPNVSPEECARFAAVRDRAKAIKDRPVQPPDLKVEFVESIGWPEPDQERRLAAQAPRIRALDPADGRFPERAAVLTRERVLHVHINGKDNPDQQWGLVRALTRLGSAGYAQVRWTDLPHAERQQRIVSEAARLQPTLVFMQLQTHGAVDVDTIHEIRKVVRGPVVIATWSGDIAAENSPWSLGWQAGLGRACDLTLHSSLSHVHVLRSLGIHSAGYLQIGYDEAQYAPREHSPECASRNVMLTRKPPLPAKCSCKPFDVCFLGSRYQNDIFSASMKQHDAALRDAVIDAMQAAFGDRFGLFGNGFDPPREVIPVSRAHEAYWRSHIGLNVSLANNLECYSSDRLHRILGCGSLLLIKAFPMMNVLGLEHGVNCLAWETAQEAVGLAKEALAHPDDLAEIAQAGAKLAQENHSWDVRVLELIPYLNAVRGTPREGW